MDNTWWKKAVVYQIYVRSFKDSNSDGIGDLNGILSKIPYLKDLGIDAVYLNPVNKSPNDDYGYDVSDFYAIMDDYGTLKDFDHLLKALHQSEIRLIMDLVINHSSDEHPWFQEAKKSRDNPCHDFYIWKAGKKGVLPNNWPSFFGGPAWEWNEATKEYYLHLFSKKQPDFNYTSEALREEIKKIIRFWIDRGVDGFRFDAVNHIAKDLNFPDGIIFPGERYGNFFPFVQNRPEVHDYLKELRRDAIMRPDIFVAGEAGGIGFDNASRYTAVESGQLDILFHFDMHSIGRGHKDWIRVPVNLRDTIKRSFSGWSRRPLHEGWNPVFFSNHDTSRTVSRIGDEENYWQESAKALCLLQMSQRGTPFIYYGDEIGMTNARNYELTDYRDAAVFQKYREQVLEGDVTPEKYLEGLHNMNRDNARTPMQWSGGAFAGFSDASPWISLNSNHRKIHVEDQKQRDDSILSFYRSMIRIRKAHPALIYGAFREYLNEHEAVYVYTRILNDQTYLILLNLTSGMASFSLPPELMAEMKNSPTLLIANCPASSPLTCEEVFAPWEARLYRL